MTVTFHNVEVTIEAKTVSEAYLTLNAAVGRLPGNFGWRSNTYSTGRDRAAQRPRPMDRLFRRAAFKKLEASRAKGAKS